MQIKRLEIDTHLCLVDFKITFQTIQGGSSTILIGENGTGKSTMIDSILEIFMSFDSPAVEKKIGYNYEIEYEYAQKNHVITKSGKSYRLVIGTAVYEGGYQMMQTIMTRVRIFPQRFITFYSGANNKLLPKIKQQNKQYNRRCRAVLRSFLDAMADDSGEEIPYFPKRKYNYCDEEMTPIYLTAFLAGRQSFEKAYLQKACHFRKIDYLSIILNLDKVERLFGNDRFEGEYPENFFTITDFIDERFTNLLRRGYLYANVGKGYFEIHGIEEFASDSIGIFNFFEKLHSLFDAQYSLHVMVGNNSVSDGNLSEGQRQLIKILGMLGICKSEDCLVLMDEPDAHMNPTWKYEIKDTIDSSLQGAINTQAIIATHDPLVINGVSKEFIRVFSFNKGIVNNHGFYFTRVIVPTEDTEGMGIDGLLQSEYYGLATVLDTETRKKMDTKNDLLVKKAEGSLSDPEKHELKALSEELENMTFARNIPTDQYYDEFVAAMHKIYRERPQVQLTAEDIAERNAKAEEILRGLLDK